MGTVKDFLLKVAHEDELGKEMHEILGDTVVLQLSKEEQEQIIADKVIPFAAKLGYEFTAADFLDSQVDPDEIPDDEVDAVSGGSACYCFVGGGGDYDAYYTNRDQPNGYAPVEDVTCACVGGGGGIYNDVTTGANSERCCCVVYGEGDGYNPKHGDYQ